MGDDGATSDVAFAAFHSSATRLVSDDAAEDTVSHLAAVGASLATMEDSVIERSLDFILFPVVGVMRRASEPETNAADATPKARARRIKTLEESLRCVSAVFTRLEPGMGEPAFIGDLFCDVVAVLARSGSDPSLDDPSSGTRSSSSADLEDLRLAAVTCANDVVRLIRPRTTHARALLADKNLPAVGYATSLLVRVAHLEASAGTKGSKAIRFAALATLRDLVRNTDDPDAWSFFLPGVVSGLAKALHASSGSRSDEGAGPAGAADDSASTEAAIEALTAIVTCVLDDTCNVVRRDTDTDGGDTGNDVVERLMRMAEDGRRDTSVLQENGRVDEDEDEDDVASDGPPPAGADTSQAAAHLKVRRTARWLRETAPRVEQALIAALTPAVSHCKPSVRRKACAAAAAVIKHCSRTLRGARRTLLECTLVARGDPWDAVSGPATVVLDGLMRDGYVDDEVLDSIVAEALGDLPKLVRRGAAGGDGGRACAQRAIAAMATAGSARVARMFLTKYAVRSVTCAGLAQCFAVSADLASVGRSNELRALGQLSGVTNGAGGAGTDADATDATKREGEDVTIREGGTAYVPVLPRQPPRMLHLSNPELYDAIAKVARAVGSHCAASDGSGALAAIVDAHLDALRDSLEDAKSPGSLWQRSACAHVAALNETLRGAGEYLPGPATVVRTESNSSKMFSASRSMLQEYLGHAVWDLPTSLDDVSPERVVDGSITLATLRDDALLVCLAAEGVGVVAQACGVEFVRAGAFLPTALCPLLQKLGDPAAVVSDTASDVLGVIAAVGGFVRSGTQDGGSTREGPVALLVSANADYVVDMLSRHLRHLDDHPGAVRFFAAVLGKRTGAARRTLHLLHEPVRRALDSMGIGARRKNWRHAGTFLGCLREVSDAACAEAASLLESANGAVEDVRPLHDLIEEMERVRSEQFGDDEDDEKGDTEGGAVKAAMAEASMRNVIDASAHSDAAKAVDVPAVIVEWNRRVRHESSLSRLVAGVLTSAAPLLESSDPRVRLAAAEVCASSLSAVAACDACSGPESAVYDTVKKLHPHDVPQTHGDNERPVRVLPRVHQLWPHLVHGLGHRLGPPVLPEPFKASLTLLKRCAEVSGGEFIARRMASDAWPQLARVLELGVKHAESASLVKRMETLYLGAEDGGAGSFFDTSAHSNDLNDVDEDGLAGGTRGRETVASAPRTTETVRVAILKTLAAIGACEKSRGALRDVAVNAADAVVPFTHAHGRRRVRGSSPHTPELMGAARDAVMGLAAVAPDAVWTALATSASSVDDFYVEAPRWRRDPGLGGATPPALPEFREIMPVARVRCGVSREEAAASLELLVECGMAVSN